MRTNLATSLAWLWYSLLPLSIFQYFVFLFYVSHWKATVTGMGCRNQESFCFVLNMKKVDINLLSTCIPKNQKTLNNSNTWTENRKILHDWSYLLTLSLEDFPLSFVVCSIFSTILKRLDTTTQHYSVWIFIYYICSLNLFLRSELKGVSEENTLVSFYKFALELHYRNQLFVLYIAKTLIP